VHYEWHIFSIQQQRQPKFVRLFPSLAINFETMSGRKDELLSSSFFL
jgi:hypothetical protein